MANTINQNLIVPEIYSSLVMEKVAGKCKVAQFLVNCGDLHGDIGETVNFNSWSYIGDGRDWNINTPMETTQMKQTTKSATIKAIAAPAVQVRDYDNEVALGNAIEEAANQQAISLARKYDTDMKPIMDDLEDIMCKLGDSIYVNTLNPMPVAIGQRIESSIPADATGYVLNLDVGDFKYANCSIDYNTVKLYLDNLKQFLNDIACMPSVLGSNTNIANISEVSMQILLSMASVFADENKKWLNIGFKQRFTMFKKILAMQGISVDDDVDVIYNVSMPVASSEMVANLKALQEMGAISRETIMEKTEYVSDVEVEKKRLNSEKDASSQNGKTVESLVD